MTEEKKVNRKHNNASGKTRFTREKKPGESWTVLRNKAIANGTFKMAVKNG